MLTRGRLSTRLLSTRLLSTRLPSIDLPSMRLLIRAILSTGLLLTGGLLTGCSTSPTTFRPAGVTTPDGTGSPATPAQHMAGHAAARRTELAALWPQRPYLHAGMAARRSG